MTKHYTRIESGRMTANITDILLSDLVREDEPNEAIWTLLERTASGLAVSSAKLFVLDLDQGEFVLQYFVRGKTRESLNPQVGISANSIPPDESQSAASAFFNNAFRKRRLAWLTVNDNIRSPYFLADSSSAAFVPIVQRNSQIGFLLLESCSETNWSSFKTELSIVQLTLALMLEKRRALALLSAIYRPVDFYTTIDEFLDQLLALASQASGMRYLALRERSADKQTLKCLNLIGFGAIDDKSEMDLFPIADYPPFVEALSGTTVAKRTMRDGTLDKLFAKLEHKNIQSFVVSPVKVGSDVFGTLSFASTVEHDYSLIECRGLEAIANAIGVAISNFRSAEQLRLTTEKHTQTDLSFAALDVAQSARHEAREHIDNAQWALAAAQKSVEGNKDTKACLTSLGQCSDFLKQISSSLDKIRDATKIRRGSREDSSVASIWREAKWITSARARDRDVKVDISGDAIAPVYVDLLRIAFANLLINSMDAFERKHRQIRTRKIGVIIHDAPRDDAQISIRYFDNAGGLDQAALIRLWGATEKRPPLGEYIFERGVTTKDNGTGYGLYLVRRVMSEHGGSVQLTDSKDGCVFDMALPKKTS